MTHLSVFNGRDSGGDVFPEALHLTIADVPPEPPYSGQLEVPIRLQKSASPGTAVKSIMGILLDIWK